VGSSRAGDRNRSVGSGAILGVSGATIGVVGIAVGVWFGLDQRRSAKVIQDRLDRVLQGIRNANPKATAAIATETAAAPTLSLQQRKEGLAAAIARLPEREKLVVTLYYYEELTLREVGEVLGISEAQASQLHQTAIARLRVDQPHG